MNDIKYIAKWQKENTVRFSVRLNKATEKDIIDYLERSGNKQGIIKEALREYMHKNA